VVVTIDVTLNTAWRIVPSAPKLVPGSRKRPTATIVASVPITPR